MPTTKPANYRDQIRAWLAAHKTVSQIRALAEQAGWTVGRATISEISQEVQGKRQQPEREARAKVRAAAAQAPSPPAAPGEEVNPNSQHLADLRGLYAAALELARDKELAALERKAMIAECRALQKEIRALEAIGGDKAPRVVLYFPQEMTIVQAQGAD